MIADDALTVSPGGNKMTTVSLAAIELWYRSEPGRESIVYHFPPSERGVSARRAIFTPDDRYLITITRNKTDFKKGALSVLKDDDGMMTEIYRSDCRYHHTLFMFLNRFLFVGSSCIDLGHVLGQKL